MPVGFFPSPAASWEGLGFEVGSLLAPSGRPKSGPKRGFLGMDFWCVLEGLIAQRGAWVGGVAGPPGKPYLDIFNFISSQVFHTPLSTASGGRRNAPQARHRRPPFFKAGVSSQAWA